MAPSSALPIGATRVLSEIQPVQIIPSESGSGLLNAVLALLATASQDESERYDEEILDLPVSGFLIVCVPDPRIVSGLMMPHNYCLSSFSF
jgi:polyribonucleotide 5'-hydroxyl-kinase